MSRVAASVLSFGLIMGAAGAAAQDNERTVLFSASGGISKGAYQGGVDWTLSEFLRRQRTDAFRARIKLDKRDYVLGSATGASAGNINAVFAALAWCTDSFTDPRNPGLQRVKGIAAEESLFWKAWVDTGISELLPDKDNAEPAALDRGFFLRVHRGSLEDFRSRAVASPKCEVPVGLTLTRVIPIEVALDEGTGAGTASVQRFASVFQVVSKGTALDFAPPLDGQRDSRSLGALALLPALYSETGVDWRPRRDAVFNVIMASSSFPVAFAPIDVSYLPGGLKPRERSTSPVTAQFADGGVFDNNPLGLASGLFELGRNAQSKARRMLAYSSPGSYRGSLAAARIVNRSVQDSTGLGAAAKLLGGAFASAREYELQLFARQRDRDQGLVDPKIVPELRLSSRAFPIVGETLGSFGAFLGHPFRERDFYLGVYDGLEFIARHVLCEDVQDEMALKVCVARQHIRLVTDDVFEMSPMARQALSWFLRDEHGLASPTPFSGSQAHHTLLERTNHYLTTLQVREEDCAGGGDPIVRALCPDGLDTFLQKMHDDAAVRNATTQLAPLCRGVPKDEGRCVVDEAFADLIDHPRRKVYEIAKKAITNVELAEDRAHKRGLSQLVEAGFSIFRAATYRYRPGFQLMMSSAPVWDEHDWLASLIGYLAPGYLHWTSINENGDSVAFGWRPLTFVFRDKWFFSTQAEWSPRARTDTRTPLGWGVSGGSFAVKRLAAVEVGAFRLPHATAEKLLPQNQPLSEADRWVGRIAIRSVADKIQFTLLARPEVLTFGVGLNDVNGILFWLKR